METNFVLRCCKKGAINLIPIKRCLVRESLKYRKLDLRHNMHPSTAHPSPTPTTHTHTNGVQSVPQPSLTFKPDCV